jgi:formylglycine-generating enzyme required for sulfatase activity
MINFVMIFLGMIRRSAVPFAAVLLLGALCGSALAAGSAGTSGRPLTGVIGVGVAEFESDGYGADGIASAARGLVEQELGRHRRITLVEREQLGALLEEVSFQQSGITKAQGTAEIGLGDNLQCLLFGRVARVAVGRYRLALRVVDVATGRVLGVEETELVSKGQNFETQVHATTRRLVLIAMAQMPTDDVQIPAGVFNMGATTYPEEGPVHEVHLSAFRIDRTEVSQAAWFAWLEASGKAPALPAEPGLPATRVTWSEAVDYCRWAGKRLPTEAEWERAARGASGHIFPWGSARPSTQTARFANSAPTDVASLSPGASQEGAFHLAGNVAEWVSDWYDPTYYGRSVDSDPAGPDVGDFRVIRGGGFSSPADELRSSARGFHNALRGASHIGFRCAASASVGR